MRGRPRIRPTVGNEDIAFCRINTSSVDDSGAAGAGR